MNAASDSATATDSALAQCAPASSRPAKQLVPVVERRPAAVQVEAGGTDIAARNLLHDAPSRLDGAARLVAARERGEVTVALRALAGMRVRRRCSARASGTRGRRSGRASTSRRRGSGRGNAPRSFPFPSRHSVRLSARGPPGGDNRAAGGRAPAGAGKRGSPRAHAARGMDPGAPPTSATAGRPCAAKKTPRAAGRGSKPAMPGRCPAARGVS